jgi:hypothetical protein
MAETEIMDAEVVEEPGTEIDRIPSSGALFKTDDPVEIMERTAEVASALKEFVKAQGLTSVISGRDYLLVETWQMLGMMLGVTPGKVTSYPVEHGWESIVDLHDRSGRVVGSGSAECLDTEKTWKSRDDYARKSMAQTRAVGKAFRNTFGFIAKAAGYETTPAEEMPARDAARTGPPYGDAASEAQVESARNAIAYLADTTPDSNLVGLLLNQIEQAAGYLPHFTLAQITRVARAVRNRRGASTAVETNEERDERERLEHVAERAEG